MTGKRLNLLPILLMLLLFSGCTTTDTGQGSSNPPGLAKAQALYDQEKYTDAMIECIDLARKDPLMPGLVDLQQSIVTKLADQRAARAAIRASNTHKLMDIDVENNKSVPDTYGLRRAIRGEKGSLRTRPTSMQQALQKKVTLHPPDVDVNIQAFADALMKFEGISMMIGNVDPAKKVKIDVTDVPLQEVLDFISKNLGVEFYVGENVIWVVDKTDIKPGAPLITRMYRLRKGMSSEELLKEGGKINIVEAIKQFVPKEDGTKNADGTDLFFDKNAHVIIVRNTRENLAKAEEIIDTLDVCPPQVLIEARFISTSVTDLRELGIDWILNSPIAVTRNSVLRNGVPGAANETQINSAAAPNNIVAFAPFPIPNASEGLNFSYQGLLTDPMFRAILHALDTSGKARTLSVPKVTVVNNREAYMHVGDKLRYIPGYNSSVQQLQVMVAGPPPVVYNIPYTVWEAQELKEEDLGINLTVTPSVGADMSSIFLKMEPEIIQFLDWEEFSLQKSSFPTNLPVGAMVQVPADPPPLKLPKTQQKIVKTEMIVYSGETVVMGGLITSTEVKSQSRVPFLGSLPLIGQLFRHDSVEDTKQNLLIFVTATILSELGENLIPMSPELERPTGP